MKKIIDGKLYDTSTAVHVCNLNSPTDDRSDFNWHKTGLYNTLKGRFFVSGEGGPSSMWAKSVGQNTWSEGEGLRSVSEEEARDFMEDAGLSADAFAAVGLSVEEG